MIEPIDVRVRVRAPVEHAFEMWTARTELWWPDRHTIGQRSDTSIVIEPAVGGRIFQRDPDGAEHDWGEITAWNPPYGLTYLWFLFFDRADATTVDVRFEPDGDGTVVRLHQTGFDRLGDTVGRQRRDRTVMAWDHIFGLLVAALDDELSAN